VPADEAVPYGGPLDEEPRTQQWCAPCAEAREREAVERGRVPEYWISPDWAIRAKKLIEGKVP